MALSSRYLSGVRNFDAGIFFLGGGISAPVYRKALALNKHASTDLDHLSTLPYAQNPKEKILTLLHFKECLCPALLSNFKTNDAEVLSGIRTVCLHQSADSLLACYAAGMNTIRSWRLLCSSGDIIYVAAVWDPLWYSCIEEWKTQTKVFPSYRIFLYISSYQPLLRSSESACWRIELTCLNLRTTCSCCLRLSTVLCTHHRSGGAKLPSAVSSHFKRFHICKKHKFFFGGHLISADENVWWNHTRLHKLWHYFGKT